MNIVAMGQHPFGMLIAERGYSSDTVGYRFGFNAQERDDAIKGAGNAVEFTYRIYDPRLGKFLSVDPLFSSYPFYTPYQFAANQPIHAVDLEGLESSEDNNPTALTHTVQSGETLGEIATRYGTSPRAIANATETWDESAGGYKRSGYDRIYAGEVLTIPAAKSESTAKNTQNSVLVNSSLLNLQSVATDNATANIRVYEIDHKAATEQKLRDDYIMFYQLSELEESLGIERYNPDGSRNYSFIYSNRNDALLATGHDFTSLVLPVPITKAVTLSTNVSNAAKNVIPKGTQANHLFKGSGKLTDNAVNRTLIEKISNGKSLGVDQYGKSWYIGADGAGKSIYTYAQNGVVKGAGYATMTRSQMIAKYGLK